MYPNNPPYKGYQAGPAYPWGAPYRPKSYLNKPIRPSCRNQGSPHPLDTPKPSSLSPWLLALFPKASPMWPCMACGVLPSRLCIDVTKKLPSHPSSVRCHCLAILITPGWAPLPSQRCRRRRLKPLAAPETSVQMFSLLRGLARPPSIPRPLIFYTAFATV